jgi:hypothetical protein
MSKLTQLTSLTGTNVQILKLQGALSFFLLVEDWEIPLPSRMSKVTPSHRVIYFLGPVINFAVVPAQVLLSLLALLVQKYWLYW